MASTRLVIGTILSASALALVVACSSSSTGDGSSGGTGTSGGTSSGGSNSLNKCASTTTSTCTEAESKTYSDCLLSACDSKYTECYGPGWKSGTFGGPCGPYITCVSACPCNDSACYAACVKPTSECTSCIQGVAGCSGTCKAPACASAGSSSGTSGTSGTSGGKSCAELKACCARITNMSIKTNCEMTYESVKSSEAACGSIYSGYESSCP